MIDCLRIGYSYPILVNMESFSAFVNIQFLRNGLNYLSPYTTHINLSIAITRIIILIILLRRLDFNIRTSIPLLSFTGLTDTTAIICTCLVSEFLVITVLWEHHTKPRPKQKGESKKKQWLFSIIWYPLSVLLYKP